VAACPGRGATGPRSKFTTSIWNSRPQRELTTNPLSGKLGADHRHGDAVHEHAPPPDPVDTVR
jgi:hypothetical protein